MAKKNYTLPDILGVPMSKAKALSFIKNETDSESFQIFNLMKDAYRERLLKFIM